MCKIFALSNLEFVSVSPKLINTIKSVICTTDNDGFGYALVDEQGNLAGERAVIPEIFRPFKNPLTDPITLAGLTIKNQNSFGDLPLLRRTATSLIAHGRLSTNQVCLSNTHPFVSEKLALVHNGVVSDTSGQVKDELTSTCDSEILLRYWDKNGVPAIEKHVSGYYAIAALDNQGCLHIVKDDRADLHLAWVNTIKSWAFATTPVILEMVAKKMGWKLGILERVTANQHTVLKANDILRSRTIKPQEVTYYVNDNWKHGDRTWNKKWSKHERRWVDKTSANEDATDNLVDVVDLIAKGEKYGY